MYFDVFKIYVCVFVKKIRPVILIWFEIRYLLEEKCDWSYFFFNYITYINKKKKIQERELYLKNQQILSIFVLEYF